MVDTDLAISELNVDDAPAGLVLSTEAHWNQNEADWRFFLSKGVVFGVRDHAGRLVATAALLPYSAGNAWISMVLVTQAWRRRGLATRLVDACLNKAGELGLTTWLDATPAGAAVYGPLGFTPTLQSRRLRLEVATAPRVGPPCATAPLAACDLNKFMARDCSAIGFGRGDLLRELATRSGSQLVSNGTAMALIRDGRTARHIGPLFADHADHALALVSDIVAGESRPLLIDAVAERDDFLKGLTDSAWKIERPFQRMRFGRTTTQASESPFAVVGPEYG
jgi:GNAT superfamily N-acetyltransferase